MFTENFEFTGHNSVRLPAILWLPEKEPKQILQITHGMTEHMGRYAELAEELTSHGIAVAGFDLRGHGQNPGDPSVASFGEGGWNASIEDMRLFFELLAARFPGIPHNMLGFSLGSFLLRDYLRKYSCGVSGAVILGTGNQPGFVLTIIMEVVKSQIKKAGFDKTTDFVRQLSFGTYNKKFAPTRTDTDWLCSDERQLNKYMSDPLIRKDISAGLFWQLLGAMKRTGKQITYGTWNKEIPILLLSGKEDPVGDSGKGVLSVKTQIENAGISNVTMHLLPNARHDILHEESCGAAAETKKILIDWLIRQ